LRTEGRFNKEIKFKTKRNIATYKNKLENLSNRSCNAYHTAIQEIFEKLYHDAGLIENPFAEIPKLNLETESREAFTEQELRLIAEKADGFAKPIFIIGIATALREGDICTLKWSEVDLKKSLITRNMSKTRRIVEIPIMPPLYNFFIEQQAISGNEKYVLPEHAQMYIKNQSGITWRIKKFLESLGIKTTKKVPGRSRAISIKDVHSLRHTFCYYAGVYGIPFLVVKDIVGHVSPQMTELYQKHADNRMKREKLMQMPDFMSLTAENTLELSSPAIEQERSKLAELAMTVDIKKVRAALKLLTDSE
jgi:integrase